MSEIIEIEILHDPVKDVEVLLQYLGGDVSVEIADNGVEPLDISFAEVGPQGPAGATGPQGPAGANGTLGGSYTHTQGVPSAVWNVSHGLGYHPNVTVVDSADSEVVGDVQYVDINNLTITFGAGFGGKAYMS